MNISRVSTCARLAVVAVMSLGALTAGAQSSAQNFAQKIVSTLAQAYVHSQVRAGTPKADSWVGGTPGSVSLLNAYKATTLYDVAEAVVANTGGDSESWLLASPENNTKAEAASSDKFAQVRGFKVEISGSSGKEVDTAWESVSGGDMVIELTETSIGADKFRTNNLRGSLAPVASSLNDWAACGADGSVCPTPGDKKAVLTLIGDGGKVIAQFDYANVLSATVFKDEFLLLWASSSNGNREVKRMSGKISLVDRNGKPVPADPNLLTMFPGRAFRGQNVAFVGVGIGAGYVPYFGEVPGRTLGSFSSRNVPLLGNVSVGFTVVPPTSPIGNVPVYVASFGDVPRSGTLVVVISGIARGGL
jgi:hypothetical protein